MPYSSYVKKKAVSVTKVVRNPSQYKRRPLWRRNGVASGLVLLFLASTSILHLTSLRDTFISPSRLYPHCTLPHRIRFAPSNDNGLCRPASDIFFLKTHKCASSTVQNILMRYGDRTNLSFVLPSEGNYLGHPKPFSRSMVPLSLTNPSGFNIFCHHTRFNLGEVKALLPPDTAYVTIIRDPVSLFESMYSYYHFQNYLKVSFEEFVKSRDTMRWLEAHRYLGMFGPNQMMFDLGFNYSNWRTKEDVEKAIGLIDKVFHLVMIAELFDESLILLKEELCLDFNDVLYFPHNKRQNSVVQRISDIARGRLMMYNMADQMLYEHFRAKLERRIDEYGREKMAKEVEKLRKHNQFWYNQCVAGTRTGGSNSIPVDLKAYADIVYSFMLKEGKEVGICKELALPELPYTIKLREKQQRLVEEETALCAALNST